MRVCHDVVDGLLCGLCVARVKLYSLKTLLYMCPTCVGGCGCFYSLNYVANQDSPTSQEQRIGKVVVPHLSPLIVIALAEISRLKSECF
jgi:hypothetical protein